MATFPGFESFGESPFHTGDRQGASISWQGLLFISIQPKRDVAWPLGSHPIDQSYPP
jgi:hypothetical protein